MTAALTRSALPANLPATLDDLPRDPGGGELVVAAQQHPGVLYQAILRRFPTMINLSVVLSPSSQADPPGWKELDRLWQSAAGPWSGQLLGAGYLFLGKSDRPTVDDPQLAQQLSADLPCTEPAGWWYDGILTAGGFALWEPSLHGSDGRAKRWFLILAEPDRDDQLSDWTWSSGLPVLPPLGRHLRHAAAVRHQVRVWQEADDMRRVQHQLDTVRPEELVRIRADLAYWRAALREMRQSMRNTEDAMRAALGPDASATTGPLADDLALVAWLRRGLKDDLANLAIADDRARALTRLSGETPSMPSSRDVFVIHGRDDQARRALWSFLQAIDLHPLDWEEMVQDTGGPSPYMGEVLAKAFQHNQAAVVLMTPDDGAILHESLRDRGDQSFESELTGQPRPNVLVEAGMALGLQRDRTVIIQVGRLRPISDLGGINTIHFDGTVRSLQKIAQRLKAAGCMVNTTGTDWLDVDRFKDLAAYDRAF